MNTLLNAFLTPLLSSYGNIITTVRWLFALLLVIDVTLFGIYWALNHDNRIVVIFKRVLTYGVFIWLIGSFPSILDWVIKSLLTLGFRAVNYSGSTSIIMNPSDVFNHYFLAADPIIQVLDSMSITHLGMMSLFGLSLIILLIAYGIMAGQIFLSVISLYLLAPIALILIPLGIFKPLAYLAERAIGFIITSGLKFMVLGILLGLTDPVLATLVPAQNPDLNTCFTVAIATAFIAFLYIIAPRMVSEIFHGVPSITASAAIATGIGAATLVTSGVRAGSDSVKAGSEYIRGSRKIVDAGLVKGRGVIDAGKTSYSTARSEGVGRVNAAGSAIKGAASSLVKGKIFRKSNKS